MGYTNIPWDSFPTIKTMGVNITTIAYLRVLIIEIGSTIILMVVEAQGKYTIPATTRISRNPFRAPWRQLPNPSQPSRRRAISVDLGGRGWLG